MLTPHKDRFRGIGEAVASVFHKMGFTPNMLTLFGLGGGLLTCVLFLWNRNVILFAFLLLFWGLFDFVDGSLARMTGKASKFGSYLDAICDRVFEMAVVLTLAYMTGYWVLSFFLLAQAMMISYAKARAAMEVSVINDEWPDLMERTERSLIFLAGLLLWVIFPMFQIGGKNVFQLTLIGLNLACAYTVIQRVLRAKKIIESRS